MKKICVSTSYFAKYCKLITKAHMTAKASVYKAFRDLQHGNHYINMLPLRILGAIIASETCVNYYHVVKIMLKILLTRMIFFNTDSK